MFEDFPGYLVGKFLSLGLFIGESAIRFLERWFPQFRDQQPELFKNDYYLRDSGLSKKERLKRSIKTGIIVYFVFVFFIIAVAVLVFPRAISNALFTSNNPEVLAKNITMMFYTAIFGILSFALLMVLISFFVFFQIARKIRKQD